VGPELAPLATACVLITVVSGPTLTRLPDYAWFKRGSESARSCGATPNERQKATDQYLNVILEASTR
jgi:CPA2 family monovalent cation:H+ antiporter-2